MGAPAVLFAASGAMGAAGALVGGAARKRAAEFNAEVAERQGTVARQQATVNEAAFRREASRRMGARRAAAGGSGVALTGSPLAVLEDAAREEELSALNIRYQGALGQAGARSRSKISRFQGKVAMADAIGRAGQSLLGAGAKIGTMG